MSDIQTKDVTIIYPAKSIEIEKNKRVAAYCRVSTDSEEQGDSFAFQVKYYYELIKQNSNYVLVDIYADEGISGTSINKREEFKRMMKDSEAGKIDKIYVKSVSRFARNSLECIESIRLLNSYGTTVYFENDDLDTKQMNSEMILYIKSAFAQSEALAGSKRMSTAIRMKMQNGEFNLCTPAFGFEINNGLLVPNEKLAVVVKRIFEDYASGKGIGRIVEELNAERVAGKIWDQSTVRYILGNEKYIGDSLLQKYYTPYILPLRKKINNGQLDKYYVYNTHTAIIDKNLFSIVQKKLQLNQQIWQQYTRSEATVFDRKISCSDCGSLYKKRKRENGYYWTCSVNGNSGRRCNTYNITDKQLRDSFVRLYNRIKQYEKEIVVYTINQLQKLRKRCHGESVSVNNLDAEITMLCEKNALLSEMKLRNIIDDVSFVEQSSNIQKRLTGLRDKRKKLISTDREEACIEEFNILRGILDSDKGYLLLFDEEIFSVLVKSVIVLEEGYLLFELKCGLKFKEKIYEL